MQYVMLIIAAMLLGADFGVNKIYQRTYGASVRVSLAYNVFSGIFTVVIFFVLCGFKAEFTLFSTIVAAMSSLLMVSYKLIGFRILKLSGKIAMYTMYLMTGGMILPYIWGLLFMNEPFEIMRTVGLVIMILGIVIPNFTHGDGKKSGKIVMMCAAVFILNGGVSILSKIHQTETVYKCTSTQGFVAVSGLFSAIFAAVALFFVKGDEKIFPPKGKVLVITALSAAIGGVSYMLQLLGAQALPATVLYPFVTGGSIIFSALADLIVFKEKLSLKLAASIVLCFVGTLFFV